MDDRYVKIIVYDQISGNNLPPAWRRTRPNHVVSVIRKPSVARYRYSHFHPRDRSLISCRLRSIQARPALERLPAPPIHPAAHSTASSIHPSTTWSYQISGLLRRAGIVPTATLSEEIDRSG